MQILLALLYILTDPDFFDSKAGNSDLFFENSAYYSLRRIRMMNQEETDYERIAKILGYGEAIKIVYKMEEHFKEKDLSVLANFITLLEDSSYLRMYVVHKEIINIIQGLKNIEEFNSTIKTMQKILSRGQDPFNIREDNVRIISYLSSNLTDFQRGIDSLDMIIDQIKDQRAIAAALIYSVPTPPKQGSFYESPQIQDTFLKSLDDLKEYLVWMGEYAPRLLNRWIDHQMYMEFFKGGKAGMLSLATNLKEFTRGINIMQEFYDAMKRHVYSGYEMYDFNVIFFNYPRLNLPLKARLHNEKLYLLTTPQDKDVGSTIRNYEEFLITIKAATKIAMVATEEGELFKINLATFLLRKLPEFVINSKNTQEFLNLINEFLRVKYGTSL